MNLLRVLLWSMVVLYSLNIVVYTAMAGKPRENWPLGIRLAVNVAFDVVVLVATLACIAIAT